MNAKFHFQNVSEIATLAPAVTGAGEQFKVSGHGVEKRRALVLIMNGAKQKNQKKSEGIFSCLALLNNSNKKR